MLLCYKRYGISIFRIHHTRVTARISMGIEKMMVDVSEVCVATHKPVAGFYANLVVLEAIICFIVTPTT